VPEFVAVKVPWRLTGEPVSRGGKRTGARKDAAARDAGCQAMMELLPARPEWVHGVGAEFTRAVAARVATGGCPVVGERGVAREGPEDGGSRRFMAVVLEDANTGGSARRWGLFEFTGT